MKVGYMDHIKVPLLARLLSKVTWYKMVCR